MPKDTFYFTHDYNTRNDPKIKRLLAKHGYVGYGIFWAIVEDLYNNANALPLHYESIAFDLRTDCETIKSIINDFELFKIDGETFYSSSVQRRLDERASKSVKASESAKKRWENANALQPQSDSNAKKEIKEKEKKEKNTISLADFKKQFAIDIRAYSEKYPEEMLKEFYLYWSEPLQNNPNKCRQMTEKSWNLSGRLSRWAMNYKPKLNLSPPTTGNAKKEMVY